MAGEDTNQPFVAGHRVSPHVNRVRAFLQQYSDSAYPILRIGLGLVIFFAGAHKLIAPSEWTKYTAPWVTALWPESLLSLHLAMMINGVFEILFGLALLAGFYTTITAGIIALSLIAVVINLLIGTIMAGKFVDILIRDIGLLTLAIGITLLSAQRDTDE